MMNLNNTVTITEDHALSINKNVEEIVLQYIIDGYWLANVYTHPAVGKCYVLVDLCS